MAFGENFRSWCRKADGDHSTRDHDGSEICKIEGSGRIVAKEADSSAYEKRVDVFLTGDGMRYKQGGRVKRFTFRNTGNGNTMQIGRGTMDVQTEITATPGGGITVEENNRQ